MNIKLINNSNNIKEVMKIYHNSEKITNKSVINAIKKGHLSILEFADITIQIEDISIVTQRQIMRHRHFSFAERTLRRDAKDINFIGTDEIIDEHNYDSITKYKEYNDIKPEIRRYILPLATITKFVMKGNLRSWIEFIQKRYCINAQEETRKVAEKIYELLCKIGYEDILQLFDDKCFNPLGKNCEKCIREIK